MTARQKVSREEQNRRWKEFLEKHKDEIALSREERERRWAEQLAILRKSEEPLVAELTAAGWPPNIKPSSEGGPHSVWNLVNTTEPYPHFLPILAKHLSRPYHKRVREAIVRALAVNEAKGTDIPHLLMDELKRKPIPSRVPTACVG